MVKISKFLFLVLSFFFLPLSIFSLEVSDGNIKLILHEDLGRFSLYYMSNEENNKYTSLFTDQDPRTTTFSLVINNKVYRLGDSFSFKETTEKTNNGAQFIWKSNQVEIIQEFTFIKSVTSIVSDGVKISTIITNISDNEIDVGARFVIDTYLGENNAFHFKTNSGYKINKETKFEAADMIDYWVSGRDDNSGLMVLTKGAGVTSPDVLIFANWKRLNDTSWSYSASSSRNFSLPPYSINDSAVCQYYFPQKITSGFSTEIVFAMGNYTESGFILKKTTGTTTTTSKTNTKTSNTTSSSNNTSSKDHTVNVTSDKTESPADSILTLSIKGDILTLETILEEINNKISNGNYSTKDLELMEKIIKELKNKAESYSQNQ